MTARARHRVAHLVIAGVLTVSIASPAVAQDDASSGWWTSVVNQLSGLSGASCSAIASLEVQVLGKPFCQETVGSTATYGQGRLMRIEEVKALGLTLSMFTSRAGREQLFAEHRARLQALAKTLDDRNHEVVQVPSEVLRQYYAPPTAGQRSYQLSTATVLAFSGDLGLANQHTVAPDPAESALAARSLAIANALDQSGTDVVQQTAPRASALASGGAFGAESGRHLVEGQAMLAYVLQTSGIARSQHVELPAYRALKTERAALLQSLIQTNSFGVKP
jgi:hypothetical protein